MNYYVKQSIEEGLKEPLLLIRNNMIHKLKTIFSLWNQTQNEKQYSLNYQNSVKTKSPLPDSLSLYPYFINSFIKNILFTGDKQIKIDTRSNYFYRLRSKPLNEILLILCPLFYRIDNFKWSTKKKEEEIPERLPLTANNLSDDGVFVLTNGVEILFFIGSNAPSSFLSQLFGEINVFQIEQSKLSLLKLNNTINRSIRFFLKMLKKKSSQNIITIIRQGDKNQNKVFDFLIEDQTQFYPSYQQFFEKIIN
ncbi:sec24-related protein [Anaeramoeba flamelloides]|uniref:Sec24-related protein n=1 Tax=Anaeramoeba flamelloides TaxID=1746091 RepID=A0ABQ8XPW7_9EUKA|nr:sec24-related protein [Anaeramoeba flamelloides]